MYVFYSIIIGLRPAALIQVQISMTGTVLYILCSFVLLLKKSLLFNIFINHVDLKIKACGKGVKKMMIVLVSCSMQMILLF